jgi:hypothetical protein
VDESTLIFQDSDSLGFICWGFIVDYIMFIYLTFIGDWYIHLGREPLIAVDMETMNVDINVNTEYSLSTYMWRYGYFPTKIHFGLSYILSKEIHAY